MVWLPIGGSPRFIHLAAPFLPLSLLSSQFGYSGYRSSLVSLVFSITCRRSLFTSCAYGVLPFFLSYFLYMLLFPIYGLLPGRLFTCRVFSCTSSSALLLSSRVGYFGYHSGFVSLVFFYRVSAFATYMLRIWDYHLSFFSFHKAFVWTFPRLFSRRFTVFSLLPAACPYMRLSFLFSL